MPKKIPDQCSQGSDRRQYIAAGGVMHGCGFLVQLAATKKLHLNISLKVEHVHSTKLCPLQQSVAT